MYAHSRLQKRALEDSPSNTLSHSTFTSIHNQPAPALPITGKSQTKTPVGRKSGVPDLKEYLISQKNVLIAL